MQVLLIEDDHQFIELVERVAQSLGLAFTACTRAGTGLERLRRGDIDILIVDGFLPDKLGWEVLEELQGWPGKKPCTMFLSAHFRDMGSFLRLEKLGVAKVLHKPISAYSLRAELDALVTRVRNESSQAALRMPPEPGPDASAAASLAAQLARLRQQYTENLATVAAGEFAALIERVERVERAPGPGGATESELVDELESYCHRL